MKENHKRIYIVEDHAIMRDGLKHIISETGKFEIVGEAEEGKKAIEEIRKIHPDLIIMDISLPTIMGTDLAKMVKIEMPDCKIVMLSRHSNEGYLRAVMEFGVEGFVVKNDAGEELLNAIEAVLENRKYISKSISTSLADATRGAGKDKLSLKPKDFEVLTAREKMVVKLIAEGKTNIEIGVILELSPNTVKVHRTNIFAKLNIKNSSQLVRYAFKVGLTEL